MPIAKFSMLTYIFKLHNTISSYWKLYQQNLKRTYTRGILFFTIYNKYKPIESEKGGHFVLPYFLILLYIKEVQISREL